jgi:hypothetical protein
MMRWHASRHGLLRSVLVVAGAVLAAIAVFLAAASLLPSLQAWTEHHVHVVIARDLVTWIESLGAAGLAALTFGAVRTVGNGLQERRNAIDGRLPPRLGVPDWVVDRPAEVNRVVQYPLRQGRSFGRNHDRPTRSWWIRQDDAGAGRVQRPHDRAAIRRPNLPGYLRTGYPRSCRDCRASSPRASRKRCRARRERCLSMSAPPL